MKKRINCFTVGCSTCKNGIMIKKNFWGDKLYICPAYPEKHKEVSGENCGNFRCNKYRASSILCQNCRKGL